MADQGTVKQGALVEFERELPSGKQVPTRGWVTNVVDKDEYNCTHTYLVIEYHVGKGIAIYHAKEDDVKLLSKSKEPK